MSEENFHVWAIVEIFGHERLAGEVSEARIGGCAFVRVDVPAIGTQPAFTRLYGEKAIYSITPVEESLARRAAEGMQVRPVNVYLLPSPQQNQEQDDGIDDEDNPF